MKRIACSGIGLMLSFGLLAVQAGAQSQTPASDSSTGSSLGDYARQVRKAPAAVAKPKVFDNDNLPGEGSHLSIIGQAPDATTADNSAKPGDNASAAPAAGDAKPSSDAKPGADAKSGTDDKAAAKADAKPEVKPGEVKTTPKTADEDQADKQAAWKQWGDKIAAQKDQIDLLSRELDVLQREYQIRAAAMYADAGNRMRNETNWDQQDAKYKQDIADKQKALDEAKQALEDMQEQARKAGTPASVREP